jgi:hypothetical protein
MFPEHRSELNVIALIKIPVVSFVFSLHVRFHLCRRHSSLPRLARFRLSSAADL